MKYIYENESGFTTYDKYFNYIKSIKKHLSNELYEFASESKYYDLKSRDSLHDSWVQSLSISNKYNLNDADKLINIELKLLGPYHDRVHTFIYEKVEFYEFKGMQCYSRRKDDLLCHEIRYCNGFLEHEIIFDNNIEFLIMCSDIKHNVKELSEHGRLG